MLKNSVINNTAVQSPLAAASRINRNGGKSRKNLVATVLLTSLVDAFSILVIYLLVNMNTTGEILYLSKDTELPAAERSEVLSRNTLVKLEEGKMFVEEKEVQQAELVAVLVDIRKELAKQNTEADFNPAITVQADRRTKYDLLNQIVLASSQAGFGEIKFAVLAK